MKVRVGVEMLAALVVLFLALGASDGVVMNKCELGDKLNSTLPENLLDQITDLVAKIVCHVELSSHFNTSAINHVIGPNVHSFIRGGRGGRKGRSAESSSEESSEEDSDSSSGEGRRKRSTSTSSSEESSEEDSDSSSGEGRRKRSTSTSSSEESSEEDSDSSSGEGRRKRSTSTSSSEESSEEDSDSSSGAGRRKRSRSRSSSEKSNKRNMWTLYGLFQLPDRIACTSGSEPSLDLCSMACDSLIDDNITDDIACVETILNKMLSAANNPGPNKALFNKLYANFFQKECKNVEDLAYFSTC
ncbi:uncharacterized protein LOC128629221 isoform X2 [Ictalurus punctatus]|uniref:Uncharacterized protein LOC128629221 isoform X2 n=1 Tax=Ictalurus punctatus TaxID=7998 RepID=A0A9F7TGM1_ICTPU|nr:uncharacterized protein LOC128629221 isoform X2 [Ictalurus punctatus]